jgi:hypothetical protein
MTLRPNLRDNNSFLKKYFSDIGFRVVAGHIELPTALKILELQQRDMVVLEYRIDLVSGGLNILARAIFFNMARLIRFVNCIGLASGG